MTKRLLIVLVYIIFGVINLQAQDTDISVFESISNGMTFEYPADWMVLENFDSSPIVVINDSAYLEGNGRLESGQMRIDILTLPPTPFFEPRELLEDILENAGIIVDEPISEVNIGTRPAAYFEVDNGEISRVAIAYELEENTQPILIFVAATIEDIEDLLPSALDVIATIDNFPPELEVILIDTQQLTETYTTANNAFTFNYPLGWEYTSLVEEDDNVILALLNPERLNPSTELPDSILLTIDKVSQRDQVESLPFDQVLDFIEATPFIPEGTQPSMFSLDGRNAAYVEVDDDVSSGMYLVVMVNDETYITIMFMSVPDSLDELRPIALGIAQTLEPVPPMPSPALPLSQSHTAPDGSYMLMYPEDWFIQQIGSQALTVITTIENFEPQALQSGNIMMTLSVVNVEGAEPSDYVDIVLAMTSASYDDPIEMQIGDRDAIRLEAFADNRISFITSPTENHIAILNVSIAENDVPQYSETLVEILESITIPEE